MPPITYILLTIFTAVILSLAEKVSVRPFSGRSQALIERPKSPNELHFIPPPPDKTQSDSDTALDLLDILLVASVDGKFHALNRTSGRPLWSTASFASPSHNLPMPSPLSPLVRTTHIDYDPDLADDNIPQETYIIEPQTGDIYVMATPTSPLQRFPFSMSELVDMSPFSFADYEDRRVFVGRKETSLLVLELETGRIKATLDSECHWDQFEDLHAHGDAVDLDELEGSKPPVSTTTEVYIGRTDYHISIKTRPHKHNPSVPRPPVQNLVFSTYGPNNQDNHLQASYRRTKDDMYVQSMPSGEILAFKARSQPESAHTSDSQLLWAYPFNEPIVAIFDVLQKHSDTSYPEHPIVLLQPRPRLQDVLPNFPQDNIESRSSGSESAYVGIVGESGSLYALSPEHFPLVAFGGSDRRNTRLIDAPQPYIRGQGGDETPIAVDEITRTRKLREEKAFCERDPTADRRCFTGMRDLDLDGQESKIKRLLDGAPRSDILPIPSPYDAEQPNVPLPVETVPNVTMNETRDKHPLQIGAEVRLDDSLAARLGIANKSLNFWEVLVVTIVLGIASFWFGSRHRRESKSSSRVDDKIETAHLPIEQSLMISSIQVPVEVPETVQESVLEAASPAVESALTIPIAPLEIAFEGAISSNDVGEDGEDSEREGEQEGSATPGKRKGRRGKRGKKKKNVVIALPEDPVEDPIKTPGASRSVDDQRERKEGSDGEVVSPTLVVQSPKLASPLPSLVVSDTILGFGSHGTIVFQGSLQGRAVAVKRLLQDFVTLASREVSILQESDDHPNVIRYYYQEAHANFLYIALELCPASLADIIERPDCDQWRDIAIAFEPKKALRQITSGLRHLHALKLVHRDIKPQNILISTAKAGAGKAGYRMLISDFGLTKKLEIDQTSFLPTAHGASAAGTVGWRAPEILRGEVKLDDIDDNSMSSRGSVGTASGSSSTNQLKPTRLTKAVDIFALGCLFYYTMTSGGHPFGDRFEREVNILKNAKNLDGLDPFGEEGAEAADLMSRMLDPEASRRPDTTACLLHPFFWDSGRRLNFLQDASDRFEIMCRDPKDQHLLSLETGAFAIVGHDWHSRLDRVFNENLGKFRKYDGKSVQDLLRALRNKKHHYQDLPDNVKRNLGQMPEGFLAYFTKRFPLLFLHVHTVIGSSMLRTESMFRSYFELPDS